MSNIFRIQETGRLVDRNGLIKAFPNVSFPKKITQESLSGVGADVVHKEPRPVTTEDQTSNKGVPVQKEDGLWYENWIVQDRYTEYTDADGVVHTVEEQKAAVQAEIDTREAEANRNTRNRLLSETDYLALSDMTLSPEMAQYRQSLRDITSLENWPNLTDLDWPVKP